MRSKQKNLSQIKKEIINELNSKAKELGHSPQRREVPNLATKCYKIFGSFNKAKIVAGLAAKYVKITRFPKDAFKLDKDLASIASYLTFDGHLFKDFKGFYYSSKNIKDLIDFENIVKRKFGLPARYHLFNSGSNKQTHVIYFFNKKVCEYLFDMEVPKGDKVMQKFDVPEWILKSKEFSRTYLKIAYLCEGSFKEEAGRTPRISINTAKWSDIIDSGLNFMNRLREMLGMFDIQSHKCYISGERIRKRDNRITRDIRFRIKIDDNNKFIREIGWLK